MKDQALPSDDQIPDEAGALPISTPNLKARKVFSRINPELSDKELASSGVQKMMVEELGRNQEAIGSLEAYREKYYDSDKKLAIELEKNKKNLSFEIISAACLAIGSAAFGYAPSLTSLPQAGYIAVAFAAILTLAGLIAKAIILK